jgi:hypothetical protein
MNTAITFASGFVSGGFLIGVAVWYFLMVGFDRVLSAMVERRRFTYDGKLYHLQLIRRD